MMAKEGRVTGRVNGDTYEIVHRGIVTQSYSLEEARKSDALKQAIVRNNWEEIP